MPATAALVPARSYICYIYARIAPLDRQGGGKLLVFIYIYGAYL